MSNEVFEPFSWLFCYEIKDVCNCRVNIDGFGQVEGVIDSDLNVVSFLGVPYAETPKRFEHSVMKESLDGTLFKAHEFGNQESFKFSTNSKNFVLYCETS